jgi:hypothetical protein
MKHVKLNTIQLRNHLTLNERWVQDVISEDPNILGVGNVVLIDRERIQPRAGRLDLLLQDEDGHGRYEVEIQLGVIDESHIIRTIEYWDIERRRYPKYDHTAVIIAEDITSRFLNVVSLFNGFIPLMAIQMTAVEQEQGVSLLFTKVLDTVSLGYPDEEDNQAQPTDRNFWETQKGTAQTVGMADKVLGMAREFAPTSELSYNKHYIGFWVNGRACNFAICRPQKNALRLEISLPKSDATDNAIEEADIEFLDYDSRWGNYRLKLGEDDLASKGEVLKNLLNEAYILRT